MTILNQLASQMDRADEQPNIELAHRLIDDNQISGVYEIIENLANKNKKIQHDCIKVAYEIGVLKPELISPHILIFIGLLKSRDNRMVWGALTALSTFAEISSSAMMDHLETLLFTIKQGSVITVDKGILTLAKLASVDHSYNERIFPFLLQHLATCRSKEVPQHAESTLIAVTDDNKLSYVNVLTQREPFLTLAQLKRIKKIYKTLSNNE
ncbi:hypothetical protein ACP8HI_02890 [Paenibacillus sp. FA6]|uniref:hypothetical protein n=1 Tax=Paenibacillus sp. FA6 TaxID=3413029 RepID=UPI003F660687